MTTFKFAGSYPWKAIVSAAVLMLWGCGVYADGLQVASSAPVSVSDQKPVCPQPLKVLDSALSNRYVLLLFFDRNKANKADIKHAFDQDDPPKPGCIRDPDQDAKGMRGIIVQGSCPTDCAHESLQEVEAQKKPQGGDPLKRTVIELGNSMIPGRQIFGHQKAVWALYLADPNGAKEEADGAKDKADGAKEQAPNEDPDDPDLTFLVWQILAKDACHAGRILKSLKQSNDTTTKKVFTKEDGYLGQIMIGYKPRWKLHKSVSTTECKAVEPRHSESSFLRE